MYYLIQADIYSNYGVVEEPELPCPDISFLTGRKIKTPVPLPLIFTTNFDARNPPRGFTGNTIPVWSLPLINLYKSIGVDNIQSFDAKLINSESGKSWPEYKAVNIIGLLAAADLTKSKYIKICDSPDGIPFIGFEKLVLNSKKTEGKLLFRLAECPTQLLAHEKLIDALKNNSPENGWGISATPVDEI